MWEAAPRVSAIENEGLLLTLSEQELEQIVKEMKIDTMLGPYGLPVVFFKKHWPMVKHGVLHIINDFILGRIDISRVVGMTIRVGQGQTHLPADVPRISTALGQRGRLRPKGRLR
jgi:hypothetical protein